MRLEVNHVKTYFLLAILFFIAVCNSSTYVYADDFTGENNSEKSIIEGFGQFDISSHYLTVSEAEGMTLDSIAKRMPATLTVYLKDTFDPIDIPVSWYCISDDFGNSNVYYYQFSPRWDESKYSLSGEIDLWTEGPYIGVFIEDDEDEVQGASVSGNANEVRIYNYLTQNRNYNSAVACGIMANIYSESGFRPNNLQNSYEKSLGFTDESYTSAVDSGSYTNFVHDSAGYGLCQWTFWSRKQDLLNFKNSRGSSIGDLNMQLDFMMQEFLKGYSSLNTKFLQKSNPAQAAYDAGYDWCYNYERPAGYNTGVSDTRGNLARNKFWPEYGSDNCISGRIGR